MHPNASFVNSNDANERWSTFEDYKPLISLLYLAVIDKEVATTKDETLETRMQHFINELALIGRSHNWDKTRINAVTGKSEEYDDLEGDRPSCFSGVKRRLFQSVRGHPLFELTEEKIEAEIRQFAFEHFKSLLTDSNKHEFKAILDEVYMDLDEHQVEKLQYFDIPNEKQETFMRDLGKKYGMQFEGNKEFKQQVRDTLSINPEAVASRERYQVLKLYDLTHFYHYLEENIEKEPINKAAIEPATSKDESQKLESLSLSTPEVQAEKLEETISSNLVNEPDTKILDLQSFAKEEQGEKTHSSQNTVKLTREFKDSLAQIAEKPVQIADSKTEIPIKEQGFFIKDAKKQEEPDWPIILLFIPVLGPFLFALYKLTQYCMPSNDTDEENHKKPKL